MGRIPKKVATANQRWVALTEFERRTVAGFLAAIAGAGLDTYGLSNTEKAAIDRVIAKLNGSA